jgi:hypothetical protein
VDLNWAAFPEELTMIDLVNAGDALGEDRLARAVVPHERGDLSSRQIEVDVVQRLDRTKVLLDAAELE